MNIIEYTKNFGTFSIKPVNLMYGQEEYLYKNFLEKASSLYKVEILWGDEISSRELLEKISGGDIFLSQKRLLIVKKAQDFFKKVKDKTFIYKLSEKAKNVAVFFVILEKLSSQDLQQEPIKTIATIGDVIEIPKVDKKKVRELVKSRFEKEKVFIENEALELLLSESDYDLMKLRNEVDKLLLLGKESITVKDIREITFWDKSPNVFDFLDAFFTKDKEGALMQLSSLLRNGISPLQIIATISNYAIKLYTIHRMVKEGAKIESAAAKLNIKQQFQIMKFKTYLEKRSERELKTLIFLLYQKDMLIKVFFENPEQVLRDLVIEF